MSKPQPKTKPGIDHAQVQTELSKAITSLLLEDPFFGHLLGSVTRAVSETDTPTAAVAMRGPRPVLIINPIFFTKTLRKSAERVGTVKHEALHLLFKHLLRLNLKEHDLLIFNLAADLVVNQFIKSPHKLPEGCIVLASFPDLELKPDQGLPYYYDALKKCRDSKKPSKSKELIERLAGAAWHSDHRMWGRDDVDPEMGGPGFAAAGEAEVDRLIVQAKDRAGPRAWGALPNALRDIILAALERRKPKLDWKRALRLFGTSARRTCVRNTVSRKSKRYGTVPGIRLKRYQHLAVVIDTSGSITDHDLSEFFAEIGGMWRHGAQVTVVEADAAVQRAWEYRGVLPVGVGGRGGTSFDPALAWVRDYEGSTPFDGCIYLTDGVAPAPTVNPGCSMCWVVLPGGQSAHLRPGRVIPLPVA